MLVIQQVPTVTACEQLGKATKELTDHLRPEPVAAAISSRNSPPAAYRCVVVNP